MKLGQTFELGDLVQPRQNSLQSPARTKTELVDPWVQSRTKSQAVDAPDFNLTAFNESFFNDFAPTMLDHEQFVPNVFGTLATQSDLRRTNTLADNRLAAEEASPSDRTMEVSTFRAGELAEDAAFARAIREQENRIGKSTALASGESTTSRRQDARNRFSKSRNRSSEDAATWAWIPLVAILPVAWLISRLWINNDDPMSYSERIRAEQDAAVMKYGRQAQQKSAHHITSRHANRQMVEDRTVSADVRTTTKITRESSRHASLQSEYTSAAVASSLTETSSAREQNATTAYTKSNAESTVVEERERSASEFSSEVAFQDFTRLRGIDARTEELLHVNGLTHYWQLARAEKLRLRKLLDEGGQSFQSTNPQTWPKQAAFAMFGHWDELQTWLDASDQERESMCPGMSLARQSELQREQTEQGDCDTELALLEEANALQLSVDREMTEIAEQDSTRNFSAGHSETWTSIDHEAEEFAPTENDFVECDDLTQIQGIGPATERFLNGLGIHTFEQLVAANVEELRRALEADVRFREFEPRLWQKRADEICTQR